MTLDILVNRIIGFSLLYVQTGNPAHREKVEAAKVSLLNLSSGVKVVKEKKGTPTVIEFNGNAYVLRHRDQMNRPPGVRAKRRAAQDGRN